MMILMMLMLNERGPDGCPKTGYLTNRSVNNYLSTRKTP